MTEPRNARQVSGDGGRPLVRVFAAYSAFFLVICLFYAWRNYQGVQDQAYAELSNTVRLYAQNLHDTLVRHRSTMALLGEQAQLLGAGEERQLGTRLTRKLSDIDVGMLGFSLLDGEGVVLAGSNLGAPEDDWRVQDVPQYQAMLTRLQMGEDFVIGRPTINQAEQQLSVPIALAQRAENGQLQMIVGASFRSGPGEESWVSTEPPAGMIIAAVGADTYLVHGRMAGGFREVGGRLSNFINQPIAPTVIATIFNPAQPNGTGRVYLDKLGVDAMLAWQRIDDYGMVAVGGYDSAVVRRAGLLALDGPAGLFGLYLVGALFLFRYSNALQNQHDNRLNLLAHHDSLTQLPNRRTGLDRLSLALGASLRDNNGVGLLFIDLDNFKGVNDAHGHGFGDTLLCAMRDIFVQSVRPGDTVARQGGDEFLIVLPQLANDQDAELVAERIIGRFRGPLLLEGQELFATVSVGIAVAPKDSPDAEELMRFADIALYHAKELGKNRYSFYSDEMNARAVRRALVEKHLRFAVERRELSVSYQPQVDVMGDFVSGVEALVRWHSTEIGIVSPAEFIPVAEELGLIGEITRVVLETAMHDIVELNSSLDLSLKVSVNVATRQFRDSNLPELVEQLHRKIGLPVEQLVIELTESGLVENFEHAREQLLSLREMGAGVSIDDFGTGYSSLSYLNRLPISELKIDRSFVNNLCDDKEDRALARSIIALGHGQRVDVVAEGVESVDQVKLLISMGCGRVQGYFFSPPLPIVQLKQQLLADAFSLTASAS